MKLLSDRSVSGRRALALVPVLGLAIATLFFGCGRTPPPPAWEPTAAETTAINAIAEAKRNLFTTGMAELAIDYINTDLPGTTQTLLDEELIGNPFKQRFRADSMRHIFDSMPYRHSFIAVAESVRYDTALVAGGRDTFYVIDTTATVTFVETIPGRVRFHAYGMTKFLRDTGITKVTDYARGYAAGPGGRVVRTTDGGASWSQISTGTTADLNSVCFPLDYAYGYAAGSGGTIVRTTDGGDNWLSASTGTSENLNGIFFPYTRHKGYAVGDNGTIIRSVNFGQDWSARVSGTTEHLRAVAFYANQRSGIAVGDNGTALRTTNDSSWAARTSGTTERLNAVALLSDNTSAYAVGDNGTIIKSSNAGTDWTALTSGTTQHLRGVNFPTLAVGFVVGDNGTILRTGNSGSTWEAQTSNTGANLRAVQFPENSNNGWAFADNGTVVVTTNSGSNWTAVSVGGAFSACWFGARRETLVILPYYDSVFTHTDSFNPSLPPDSHYIDKEFTATTISGCVLKKEAGEWQFWKIGGGSIFYAPNPQDAPFILYAIMSGSQGTDTIFLRPDTLHFGVQGLYEVDSLPTFRAGDSVRVSGTLTNVGDAADYLYLVRDSLNPATGELSRLLYRRIEFDAGRSDMIRFDSLIPPGLYRLYLEHIPIPVFWDRSGRYTGTIWGIPLLVK